ncbi:hypothetical protein GWL_30780 [Herbaspirillum sp. GW103]|jgi:hypothetical protein|uniref:DUF3261 domain-containing protein n=1 Tax=unclassified Herbaspirillum TaxID=2624150 RepID=UPI00025E3903|nr:MULTISPECIES: DUF3261 domain-containing protein [unclassified Herbaspirillum]EIJ46050.1 hypothetical protein GWL_30780 [Herbaspirillum sp. GW103]NUT62315.1 DUF3261 domain-containing protein [Herbaspirillum sp. C9C3]
MKPALLLAAMTVAFLLAACAAPMVPDGRAPARLSLRLSPAALGQSISLQQHLTVERGSRVDQLDTALEIDAGHVDLVGLAFGQRVMSLHYDGQRLQVWRHALLPSQVQGEDVLQDVQLTLWPTEAIRQALPEGWELREAQAQRTLLLHGETIAVIDYPDQRRWGGKVILNNLRYHYKLTIQSVVTSE